MSKPNIRNMPVVKDLSEFDKQSGNILERLIFNYRQVVVAICLLATLVFVYLIQSRLELNASFEKIMPQSHPYIKNYLQNKDQLRGLGDSLRIVVENPKGNIFDADYLETLRQINDEVFLVSGVDRAWMKSLWMPVVRWTEVTDNAIKLIKNLIFINTLLYICIFMSNPPNIERQRLSLSNLDRIFAQMILPSVQDLNLRHLREHENCHCHTLFPL